MLPAGEDNEIALTLDELAREGARRMIAAALRAEADGYVERFSDELDEEGHRLVVRNGRARERRVTVGSGTLPVRAPRVNDKRVEEDTGERRRFSSKIMYAAGRRRSTEVLAILYLRGPGPFARRSRACSARTPPACRPRRSAGCARSGRPTTSGSASGCLSFSR
jgi:putative transposase